MSEGQYLQYHAGGWILVQVMRDPHPREIAAVSTGTIRLALVVRSPVLVLLGRCGDLPWSDAPFTWHRTVGSFPVPDPAGQARLQIRLRDAQNGQVCARRDLVLDTRFTLALHTAVQAQAAQVFDARRYDAAVDAIQRESPERLAACATVRWSSDDDPTVPRWLTGTSAIIPLPKEPPITLTVKRRDLLREAARQAGAQAAEADSLTRRLVLAWIARTGELPTLQTVQMLARLDHELAHAIPAATVAPERMDDLREAANEVLASDTIGVAAGRWNAARMLMLLGAGAWTLRGEAARRWGTIPVERTGRADGRSEAIAQRQLLGLLAGLCAPATLPAPVGDGTMTEVWIDWISLASGPDPVPVAALRPSGLGTFGSTAFEGGSDPDHLTLAWAVAETLMTTANRVLATADRPAPRLIGRLIEVPIDPDLLPAVAAWEIAALRVQPQPHGLYVAAFDATGRSMGAWWWSAQPESAWRAALTVPLAAWVLLHGVLCGLWRDLCAEAIRVDAAPPIPTTARAGAGANGRTPASVTLPPVVRVRWASESETALLKAGRAGGDAYRRLPADWATRQGKSDFQQRRVQAGLRAASYGRPAPAPGFTFVQPFGRDRSATAPIRVEATGLWSVMLALQALASDESAPPAPV